MNTQVAETNVTSVPAPHRARRTAEPAYGIALVDRQGNLLGAGTVCDLPGEVEVPLGINLREKDLRSYFGGGRDVGRGRRFPLASATWVQVRSTRVRVGIYMEAGDWVISPERLDLDLTAVAAILSSQIVA